jgi:hypothetical protein
MKLKFCASLLLGMLAFVAQAGATHFDPFLAVDIDGYNAGGGQSLGPTEAGFVRFEAAQGLFLDPSIDWGSSGAAGLTNVYGGYTVNIKGFAPMSELAARNRGANAGALSALTQDFLYAQRGLGGFGRHYVKLTVSGLTPAETYEFTGWAREPFNGGVGETDSSYNAWSDRATIGLDGPAAYMDANFGVGSLYGPVYSSPADPMTDGTYKNPIPTLRRTRISGPDSADPYAYAASFYTTADASGVVEVYTWADPQGYGGTQTASLLNGFQLAAIPEPASLALLGVSLVGFALRRVR